MHDDPLKRAERNRAEMREWLGLTPADLLLSLGGTGLIWMFVTRDRSLDAILAVVGLATGALAIGITRKPDPRLSEATNKIRVWAYPVYMAIIVAVVAWHFAAWQDRVAWPELFDRGRQESAPDSRV